MRELLLAAVPVIALTEASHAEIGLNLETFEQCAALLKGIRDEWDQAQSADWYEAASEAFIWAAAEERIRIRGDVPRSWLQIKLQARIVEKNLGEKFKDSGQPINDNPDLFDFCSGIGEAILPAGQ